MCSMNGVNLPPASIQASILRAAASSCESLAVCVSAMWSIITGAWGGGSGAAVTARLCSIGYRVRQAGAFGGERVRAAPP